ncbi:MAG: phosphoglycerate mutase, partial [Chloroflexota bacterium]
MPHKYLQPLLNDNKSKIVLLLLDGLGGLPLELNGTTELESANTPNLDRLAKEGTLGQTIPIRPGITPGSGPAHLALFGYDPLTYDVGRGALSATGVGIQVNPGDVAARGNFCTLDSDGLITDRRAGRISNEIALPLVKKLKAIKIEGVEIELGHVKEYRFAIVMRGENLDDSLLDTDPQITGAPPHPVIAETSKAEYAAGLFQAWVAKSQENQKYESQANG